MVYDLIPFFNELDILKLRLNILNPYVDKFIIEEATTTFSGEPKELCFEKNRDMFKEFLDKIIYVVVDEDQDFKVTHERDYFQKNHLTKGLDEVGATEDDVIIFGDADEIPNPEVLTKIIETFDKHKVYHLAQRNFYVYVNNEERSGRLLSITGEFPEIAEIDRKWLGTKITSILNIPKEGIVRLRDLISVCDERSVRVADGGWHFGYMGGCKETNPAKRIGVKVKAAAHQELNDKEILAETMDHLVLGQDIFGRNAKFERCEVDETYPEYLREHLSEYSHLVMPKVTALSRTYHYLDITAGRFCRKAFRKIKRIITRR
ncbi:beta-1,4-mannosyl-glycoprotein beta-1,4-N-acetylglucosaminyltransferase [Butyrivibrio hungatei DSM 14810]|uniref:Beta-1,4-mannosyl-glycoprotein beta-1,4-N-acetylglucosaminyltransferase n=1 Tax=Butyrivibrio hungatei DSM 14810 TaxID=1121132 RepID=A0A1M7RZJ7_9FIRM|nr:glycosyltransferase [Butyrivibrio hungatei]SHN51673.1 beta-1,4-mannosyl-glycoprotein beta-1,4-N-acetylglucosaminyltransferase [Butyrivibrio hungatei DSM 14810]